MTSPKLSEKEVARYWNQNAESWTKQVRKGWDGYRRHFNNPAFFKFIGNLKGKTVLDAGCGEGYNTRLLARKGVTTVDIDISRKIIKLAQQEEKRRPLGIRYEVASFSDLSLFNERSFDAVVSFMALMDSPHFNRATEEFFRVLRPGGNLIFSITHPCFDTKGSGWIRDEQGNGIKFTVSDYFDSRPRVERWKFTKGSIPEDIKPFVTPFFWKTLSGYLNELINAGFTLKEIKEPRPSKEACKKHPWLKRWRDHAALYLYVRAEKPSD